MFLLVRTKDQLKKTAKFFKTANIEMASFAISSIALQKIEIEDDVDGFIVTSANAVLSIPQTKLPFFCVGETTRQEALDTGRRVAFTGTNGAADMAKQIANMYPPETLVHAAGDTADISWHCVLEKAGIHVKARLAYNTNYTEEINQETLEILNSGKLKAIVFFSIQGAKHFTSLLKKHQINPSNFIAITFSKNIATQCSEYKYIHITATPELKAVKNVMESL